MALIDLFFNREKLAKANAVFRERMAEIDANSAEQKREREYWRAKNKEQFHEKIAQATNERNAKLGKVKRV